MAEKCSNWGRWGPDDEIGALNFVTPEKIADAAKLAKKGKVFALGLDFARNGPQFSGSGERFNVVHTMLRTGSDACMGKHDNIKLRYADDIVTMPLQSGTQWDGLSHVFYKEYMWNGFSAAEVDSFGAHKCGIEKGGRSIAFLHLFLLTASFDRQTVKDKMQGRGVLLDMARFLGKQACEPGLAFTSADLDACAKAQGVEIKSGDFVMLRTGHKEDSIRSGDWQGYIGPVPGLALDACEWIHKREVAAVCSDTYCVEVVPSQTTDAAMPLHWVILPKIGAYLGEMLDLAALAEDCAADGVYEFLFVAPPIPVYKAVGSPINPIAIK